LVLDYPGSGSYQAIQWEQLTGQTMTIKLNAMTTPDFLEARYKSRGLKVFCALVIFIFYKEVEIL